MLSQAETVLIQREAGARRALRILTGYEAYSPVLNSFPGAQKRRLMREVGTR
jgi:hypothetical protein